MKLYLQYKKNLIFFFLKKINNFLNLFFYYFKIYIFIIFYSFFKNFLKIFLIKSLKPQVIQIFNLLNELSHNHHHILFGYSKNFNDWLDNQGILDEISNQIIVINLEI